MANQLIGFLFKIQFNPSYDNNEIDILAHTLREELLELDVDSVESAKTHSQIEGVRGIDVTALDSFTVSFAANLASSLITPIIICLWNWVRRNQASHKDDQVSVEVRKGGRSFAISSSMSKEDASEVAHIIIELFKNESKDSSL